MIIIESINKKLWNIEFKVVDIIQEAITSDNDIIISLNNEGPCLRSCKLYDILDVICQSFSIDKKRFTIYTLNNEEWHDEYHIIINNNVWIDNAKTKNSMAEIKNTDLLTIGCFVGQVNWPRLAFVSWLDHYYKNQSIITCHYDANLIRHILRLDLNDITTELPNETTTVIDFLKTCPRKMPESDLPYGKLINPKFETISNVSNFSKTNAYFFVELVCESYYSGMTYFPTEKTFRPITQLTPFIVFGPQGYLANLQRCGFKTFDAYWDERYDNMSEKNRVIEIRKILTKLFTYTSKQMTEMYQDMLPILQYNKDRLAEITYQDLKLVK